MATDTQLTPLFKQYWEIKRQYPDVILLFRLGDFYEMFGEDAQQAAEGLNLTFCSATIQDATAIQHPHQGPTSGMQSG